MNKRCITMVIFMLASISTDTLRADDNLTAVVDVTGRVIPHTCSFNAPSYNKVLEDIDASDFRDKGIKKTSIVVVSITCGSEQSSVLVKINGEQDSVDKTTFKNNGTAKNVALRLFSKENNRLKPGDTIDVVLKDGKADYDFKVGYVATKIDNVLEGDFSASVFLTLSYN